jgi:diaminopimelate epimerase
VIKFSKYEGTGNDFVVVDAREWQKPLPAALVREICDRHRGVGADGILALWSHPGASFEMKVQNADGSDAGMCGNGMRCILSFLYELEAVAPDVQNLELVVSEEVYGCERVDPNIFQVVMGKPQTSHATLASGAHEGEPLSLSVLGTTFTGRCHFFGNPHFTIFTDDHPMALAQKYGAALECHNDFSDRVNVGFARRTGDGFDTVVYERGVGITQACGSGACAVGISAIRAGLVKHNQWTAVHLPGGTLDICVDDHDVVTMRGAARKVFTGTWGN